MGMVVQHNMNAINAYNKLNANVAGMKKSSEKLSSGYRINRAGDDAAGLAVSEKMRSQIKGLNQAIRNSQDGINMIQTFEGAAQETHSILQRMKELATQSANGTYDNATDRAAMQLEFDQLNDELNQIADTDFNGTIVLNGGVMSDGLKEVNGDFDYANKKAQVTEEVTKLLNQKIEEANAALEEAQNELDSNNYDLSSEGAPQWNTVDNSKYNKDAADLLWQKLKLTEDGTDGTTAVVDLTKGKSVDVTFEYDKTAGTWTAKKGVITGGKNGETALTAEQLAVFSTSTPNVTDTTGKGGFIVTPGTGNTTVNAIFDATEAKTGDTVTLTFTNTEKTLFAPDNIGFTANSLKIDKKGTDALMATATLAGVTDGQMTQELEDAFNGLEDVSFKAAYGTADNKIDSVVIGGTTATLDTATNAITIKDKDGVNHNYYIKLDNGTQPTEITLFSATKAADGTATSGTALIKITLTQAGTSVATAGTIEGKISMSTSKYDDPTSSVTVRRGDDPALQDNTQLKNARDAAQAAVTKAETDKSDILDISDPDDRWEAIKNYYGAAKGVSVSDAFDNSTARLLYTENIILQTGARSKDAVNFTFNYNGDDEIDMRGLKANLDISSRENGLKTAGLDIKTAESANNAMDRIDKAINKVSMVRANFGAMQNRLEHKITNLTTTSENLTEAESTIRDTDMASEMMNYTKFNILQQAAQSMLAQANQQPQSILQLLG